VAEKMTTKQHQFYYNFIYDAPGNKQMRNCAKFNKSIWSKLFNKAYHTFVEVKTDWHGQFQDTLYRCSFCGKEVMAGWFPNPKKEGKCPLFIIVNNLSRMG
jgi:hypothetical protein